MYFHTNITIRQEVKLPVKYDVPVEFHMRGDKPGLHPGCKIDQNNHAVLQKQ
jgi:hypothetical protein